jgi:divinyl chlorophyllide a 8-vinyl-reductase
MTQGRVCVAGATGYLGSRVVAELRARSLPVVAILKDRSSEKDQRRMIDLGAELAFVDAARLQSYIEALSNADIAISCMASGNVHVGATDDFWAIDRDANIRFGLATLQAGARHMILVATFEGRASRHFTAFSDAKEAAVDAVGAACRQAGVTFTVIRPTAYFSDLTDRAFDSVQRDGQHTVVGDGSYRINPIDGADVATFIAECLRDPTKAGQEHLVGGPDTFSFREIGMLAAEVIGQPEKLKIKTIPVWSLRLAAAMASTLGLVFRGRRRSAAMLHWMIWSGTHDAVAPAYGARRLRDFYVAKSDVGLRNTDDVGG